MNMLTVVARVLSYGGEGKPLLLPLFEMLMLMLMLMLLLLPSLLYVSGKPQLLLTGELLGSTVVESCKLDYRDEHPYTFS